MFLELKHQKLEIYETSRKFIAECYKLTKTFPSEAKYVLTSQIRRAALSVHLNLAEGSSRKSAQERRRYYEISRGSLIEIDAALDVAYDLQLFDPTKWEKLGSLANQCFGMFTRLINSTVPRQ